jgi:hypothetical protein
MRWCADAFHDEETKNQVDRLNLVVLARFLAQIEPLAVEYTLAIEPLVGVGTEVIPLCLEQVRREPG